MKVFTSAISRNQVIRRSNQTGLLQDAVQSSLTMLQRRLALPVFLLCGGLLIQPCAAAPSQWEYTGSLNTARDGHTATLLDDGKVLVAGGYNNGDLTSTELYDPGTGTWMSTGSLNIARHGHTATLLADGRVLVAGGHSNTGGDLTSAEIYDPTSGIWTVTGSLNMSRYAHTATLLPDKKVLVAWGHYSRSSEIYDPTAGTWRLTRQLTHYVGGFYTATLLTNGQVLAAGGKVPLSWLDSAKLYDPTTRR
jgi:hypothetical protein